jgi:CelD/BcsL family acetyltransferase involved in cellulose biosynthesis
LWFRSLRSDAASRIVEAGGGAEAPVTIASSGGYRTIGPARPAGAKSDATPCCDAPRTTRRPFDGSSSASAEICPSDDDNGTCIRERDAGGPELAKMGSDPAPPSSSWKWERLDLKTAEGASEARAVAQRLSLKDERASLDHDMAWLLGGGAGEETTPIAYVCTDGHTVIGYVPLRIRKTKVNLYLGHICLVSVQVERHSFIGSPLFAPEGRPLEAALTLALLTRITRELPPRAVVLAYGARTDSALFDVLSRQTVKLSGFHLVRHGQIHQRRLIHRHETFDAYMTGLGRKTRENIRRHHRRLVAASDGDTTLKRYMTASEVRPFLDAAVNVSRLTYQWQLYGSGLSDRKLQEHRLNLAAVRGWLCCYVLFQRDQPIAFMMGCRYGVTYYSQEIGYDPKWRQFSVGNVLHCLVIKDLIENFTDIQEFDFLFGDAPHKRQLSNASRVEGNFYIFPNTLWGLIPSTLIRLDNTASSLSAALEKYRFKAKLRQMLRVKAFRWGRRGVFTPAKER